VYAKQKPRELSNRYGYTALTTEDLLALVLRHGTFVQPVFDTSQKIGPILEKCLAQQTPTFHFERQLKVYLSLGPVQRHSVLALYELLLRQQNQKYSIPCFTTPKALAEQFHRLVSKKQEYVYGIYLSPRLTIVHTELLTKGTTDSVAIDVRDVLYFGIKHRVRHIVLVHNHPSGIPTPSPEDTEITKKIVAAANLLSMQLLDHIIVAQTGYFSFKESTSML